MITSKDLRHIHRFLAPIMVLPLFVTALTGCVYQLLDMAGQGEAFDWVLGIHKGDFGLLDLESIYPFLNSLGLLVLLLTGILLWLQVKGRLPKHLNR